MLQWQANTTASCISQNRLFSGFLWSRAFSIMIFFLNQTTLAYKFSFPNTTQTAVSISSSITWTKATTGQPANMLCNNCSQVSFTEPELCIMHNRNLLVQYLSLNSNYQGHLLYRTCFQITSTIAYFNKPPSDHSPFYFFLFGPVYSLFSSWDTKDWVVNFFRMKSYQDSSTNQSGSLDRIAPTLVWKLLARKLEQKWAGRE
jgi:hypothetical protein